jgi:hypothetical protein
LSQVESGVEVPQASLQKLSLEQHHLDVLDLSGCEHLLDELQALLLRTKDRGVVLPYRLERDLVAGVISPYVSFDFELASPLLRNCATFPRPRASAFPLLSVKEWKGHGNAAAQYVVPLVALVADA